MSEIIEISMIKNTWKGQSSKFALSTDKAHIN